MMSKLAMALAVIAFVALMLVLGLITLDVIKGGAP